MQAQQHLLWQGQELKDDYTLDEYNIGFGAILKLVLGLRVGPLRHPSTHWTQSVDDHSDHESQDDESRPLTVLVFRDGDYVRLVTISAATSVATTAATENKTSEGQTSRPGSRKRRENESLRSKMNELQKRMQELSVKRKHSTKLPKLSKSRSGKQRKHSSPKAASGSPLYLPPLVCSQPEVTIPSESPPGERISSELPEKEDSVSKIANKARSNSLGHADAQTRRAERLFFKLSTDDKQSKEQPETSTVGSVARRVVNRARPRTSPLIGNVTEMRSVPEISHAIEIENRNKASQPAAKQTTLLHRRAAKNATSVESSRHRKKSAKVRCMECRKRLPIAGRFECRCSKVFCARHRYSESHKCKFDYKSVGKQLIASANPAVLAPKLPKI